MPKKPKAIVLDSWAVIAYLEDEPAAEKVANIIADAHEQGIPLLMTVINAGEVWYIVAREASAPDADASIKQLRDLAFRRLVPEEGEHHANTRRRARVGALLPKVGNPQPGARHKPPLPRDLAPRRVRRRPAR